MKQIGAGPFRFGPDSDEVLNNIQPKSDAERHFIQWLKNECPSNCREYKSRLVQARAICTSPSFRSRSDPHEERNHSQEARGQEEIELPPALSSEHANDERSSPCAGTATLHHEQLLSADILRSLSRLHLLRTRGTLPAIAAALVPM